MSRRNKLLTYCLCLFLLLAILPVASSVPELFASEVITQNPEIVQEPLPQVTIEKVQSQENIQSKKTTLNHQQESKTNKKRQLPTKTETTEAGVLPPNQGKNSRKIKQKLLAEAFLSGNPNATLSQVNATPELVNCKDLQNLTSLMPLYSYSHSQEEVLNLFSKMLRVPHCNTKKNSFHILQAASNYLDVAHFDALLAQKSPFGSAQVNKEQLEKIRYQQHALHLVESIEDNNSHFLIAPQVASLQHQIVSRRDQAVASTIAWYLFRQRIYSEAESWFSISQKLSAKNSREFRKAQLGQALTLKEQGKKKDLHILLEENHQTNPHLSDLHKEAATESVLGYYRQEKYAKALQLAQQNNYISPELVTIKGDILLAMAWKEYGQDDFLESRNYLNEAKKLTAKKREAKTLEAWLCFAEKDYSHSLSLFEKLNSAKAEASLAQGIISCRNALENQKISDSVAPLTLPSSMETEVTREGPSDLFFQKEFQAAAYYSKSAGTTSSEQAKNKKQQNDTPQKPDKPNSYILTNIDSPTLESDFLYRNKSGDDGTTALTIQHIPSLKARYTYQGIHIYSIDVRSITAESGFVNPWLTPVGSAGVFQGGNRSLASPPDIEMENGLSALLSYQRSGKYHPYGSLGLTPTEGVVDPAVIFTAGLIKNYKKGNWKAEIFSQPVKDSILSYTGISDPYSGIEWGRVLTTGLLAETLYSLSPKWSVYGKLKGGFLDGHNVDSNTMLHLASNLGYNLPINNFDFFSIGPTILYEHYNDNRSHFTLGHGGYFSPDKHLNISLAADFLTAEGKKNIFKGRAAIGYQDIENDEAPFFPGQEGLAGSSVSLSGGGQISGYNTDSTSSESYDFKLIGSWLLMPKLSLTSGINFRKSKGYEEYCAGINLKVFFQPRRALFSSDIPEQMFKVIW